MRISILPLAAMALALTSAPVLADSVLYSDLGTGNSVYGIPAWSVYGSSSQFGTTRGVAMLFTVAGSGNEAVDQIDLAVQYESALHTFTASVWTVDGAGHPGSQVAGAFWSLTTNIPFALPNCCNLVTQSGISGVTLTGGQQYFMVVEPVSLTDISYNGWVMNNQGVNSDMQSTSDGLTWTDEGPSPISAFDILGVSSVPEPASFLLSATGLAALIVLRRRKVKP